MRNNGVTALESTGPGEFIMALLENGPLTHDQQQEKYSQAVLYKVTVK